MSFGRVIVDARKKAGLSQKELALRIKKEDGAAISPQYLNDIEYDRRNPPGGYMLEQLAEKLGLPLDYLYYLAGKLPDDILKDSPKPEQVAAAFRSFRQALHR